MIATGKQFTLGSLMVVIAVVAVAFTVPEVTTPILTMFGVAAAFVALAVALKVLSLLIGFLANLPGHRRYHDSERDHP